MTALVPGKKKLLLVMLDVNRDFDVKGASYKEVGSRCPSKGFGGSFHIVPLGNLATTYGTMRGAYTPVAGSKTFCSLYLKPSFSR